MGVFFCEWKQENKVFIHTESHTYTWQTCDYTDVSLNVIGICTGKGHRTSAIFPYSKFEDVIRKIRLKNAVKINTHLAFLKPRDKFHQRTLLYVFAVVFHLCFGLLNHSLKIVWRPKTCITVNGQEVVTYSRQQCGRDAEMRGMQKVRLIKCQKRAS